jgi:hypothetical protein
VIRIKAGDTVNGYVQPFDVWYEPSPSFPCANCRLIRIVSPAAGTLHVEATWSENGNNQLGLWMGGLMFGSSSISQLDVVGDFPVTAGELLLYVRTGGLNIVWLSIKTSFSTSPSPGH